MSKTTKFSERYSNCLWCEKSLPECTCDFEGKLYDQVIEDVEKEINRNLSLLNTRLRKLSSRQENVLSRDDISKQEKHDVIENILDNVAEMSYQKFAYEEQLKRIKEYKKENKKDFISYWRYL